jgi:hypothetical protein
MPGDCVVVKISSFPVSLINKADSHTDVITSLTEKLHWNQRSRQKGTEDR